jgi:CBS domain-containing protein/sporulation protein YlmC with PRC-barrel domain
MINNSNAIPVRKKPDEVFFLSEVLGSRVMLHGKKIGKVADFIINDNVKLAEVTHIYVTRPFGNKSLIIPWEKVLFMEVNEIIIDVADLEKYAEEPKPGTIMLKDQILDKKVLDMEDREVEVVYDMKMFLKNGKLYVSEVDTSRAGLLRRMGLRWLTSILYSPSDRTKELTIPWTYVQPLPTNLSTFRGSIKLNVLKEKLSEIPPVDLADILEELDNEQRVKIFNELDTEHASDTLEEIDPNVQRALIASLKREKVIQLINQMTPAQAADILAVLPMKEAETLIKSLNPEMVRKVKSIMGKHEETVLNYATSKFLKVNPNITAEQALTDYPKMAKDKDVIMYLFVTDMDDKLLGVVDLREILKADEKALIKDIMTTLVISVKPKSTLKEASDLFERYEFRAIPVVDDNDKIVGVLPYRDVMRLTHQFVE